MGATNRLEFITRTTLTATASSISFQNIDTSFKKFFLLALVQNDANAKILYMRLNNDSGLNYNNQTLAANNTTITGQLVAGHPNIMIDNNNGSIQANDRAFFIVDFVKPSTSLIARFVTMHGNSAIGNTPRYETNAGNWNNTTASINRVDIIASVGNMAAKTVIMLCGSKD